ncbi:hypothetical protein C7M84_015555 [Penaeus vannamei]|uniref:Uncharacterized protein n=1 Tax=Penaeus vannamei TaxID=6689 RepID=A0A423SQC5_PENVA|nr:hypothetical protein C7M84_015555 [Penaeus vannamei]
MSLCRTHVAPLCHVQKGAAEATLNVSERIWRRFWLLESGKCVNRDAVKLGLFFPSCGRSDAGGSDIARNPLGSTPHFSCRHIFNPRRILRDHLNDPSAIANVLRYATLPVMGRLDPERYAALTQSGGAKADDLAPDQYHVILFLPAASSEFPSARDGRERGTPLWTPVGQVAAEVAGPDLTFSWLSMTSRGPTPGRATAASWSPNLHAKTSPCTLTPTCPLRLLLPWLQEGQGVAIPPGSDAEPTTPGSPVWQESTTYGCWRTRCARLLSSTESALRASAEQLYPLSSRRAPHPSSTLALTLSPLTLCLQEPSISVAKPRPIAFAETVYTYDIGTGVLQRSVGRSYALPAREFDDMTGIYCGFDIYSIVPVVC